MSESPAEVRRVVEAHVAAVNAGDVDALVAGFDEDVVFAGADDLIVGRRALRELFARSFARMAPQLETRTLVVDGDTAACELSERVRPTETGEHEFALAAFFTVRGGRIVRVKVYRDAAEPA